ncbi:unnamed protein product, partial [Callosobruchus maculatus]
PVLIVGCHGQQTPALGNKGTKCYDQFNRPQRCIPEFENAAFNVPMEATNSCGDNGPIEYCIQTGAGIRKSCEMCHPGMHDARYLTDLHNNDNPTWWQSETMYENIQWPSQVNLTLNFSKAFDITYLRLIFYSPRPESFFISKKTGNSGPWIPYQYYSATCRDTYGQPDLTHTNRGEETRALCTSEYSDISPLRDGNVAFGTLEGRPSAYNFDNSPELQEWVTATAIMITLDRLNTFGDEVFGDHQVLKSYFYAIADVAVGARCKCNGHASKCVASTGTDGESRRVCQCEHNTAGPDCNECLPFYNDAPWHRATAQNAHECKQCNCNGFSQRCFFDEKLYEQTGHGGHCMDCLNNRDGPNCERCRENFYMREDGHCIPCQCDPVGSRTLQCNAEGKCQCKPGVTGEKCDRCEANHYDFSTHGCKSCGCNVAGSFDNEPHCDAYTGECRCKENVEGRQCNDCKPGFFNLDLENHFGCTPCFCYGHSSQCSSALGYSKDAIESTFSKSPEKWRSVDEYSRSIEIKYDAISQSIAVQSLADEMVYFAAPDRFLGDRRASYNQMLEFILRVGDDRPAPSAIDIILEGNGNTVTNTIFAQKNKIPGIQNQVYKFRLHEHPDYGWQPRLAPDAFISILTNLTAIKIRGTYSPQGVGFLDNVVLETATRGVAGKPALWVEACECPTGYVGQFCESCAPSFKHMPALGGPFMPCVPCDCNNHASLCDSETGKCKCDPSHHTAGENCELCARGYYGNAHEGTPNDCKPCGCPDGGACIQVDEDIIMCTECPAGYTGHRCDICSDGYFGDPMGIFGTPTPCQICECSGNIDTNAIGNCNTTSGECIKCIHNTGGSQCEVCLPGFYGNALLLPKGDCKPCQCFPIGTVADADSGAPVCDQITGGCNCKPHVVGRNCDTCEDGYYNLFSGEGCHPCNCDPIGSVNQTCNLQTGQCYCRPGVTGLRCDHCESRKYGFSTEGCKECECDEIGSKDLQCDADGQCPCLENVEGRRCDRCKENKYDRQRGCVDCPDCYNLVQNAHNVHVDKLNKLNDILDEIERRPTVITDEDFPKELANLGRDIDALHDKVRNATGDDSIFQQVQDIQDRTKEISRTMSEIDENIYVVNKTNQVAEVNIDHIDTIIYDAELKLGDIKESFDEQGKQALENAWENAKIAGQHSDTMTSIAQEARELADDLDVKADEIVKEAEEAKKKAGTAYEIARNASNQQSHITEEARRLRHEVGNLENKLNKTKAFTIEVANKSLEAKNDALNLLNEVKNLEVPQIDIPKLKQRSKDLREEAYILGNKTEHLFEDSENLRKKVDATNKEGEELLEQAYNQQSELNDLLSDIHATKEKADTSINDWNKILNETESIYNDLKDFDSETQKSKQEADEALKSIRQIEEIIMDTLGQTNKAQQTLKEAADTAHIALEKALDSVRLANNTSNETQALKNEAVMLGRNSTVLGEDAELMKDRVRAAEGEIDKLIMWTHENNTKSQEASEKVGNAETKTKETSQKVTELLSNVKDIIAELENSPHIDDSEIYRLEEEIRKAEEQLKEMKLEEKLAELQKEHAEQSSLIEQYKFDIGKLHKDVENIEQIVNSLPNDCFRDVVLEP